LRLKKDKTLEFDDLIFDQRTLEGLGNLYNSLVRNLNWLANSSNGSFIISKIYRELSLAENGPPQSTFDSLSPAL
jgi:hypothetical protein